jgi:tRNA A-37 threonylcarbamoyl transferase component Bud32
VLDVGDTLKGGRWKLEERIGSGGMAVVFRATHKNGSRAAIKILKEEYADSDEIRERFLREGYAANAVRHPGAVTILDDEVENGHAYLVMELLEGKALAQHLKERGGKLPLSEILEIADSLLEILEAAHRNGVIHRDVKPANIFLTSDNRVKLLDFGFAKMALSSDDAKTGVGVLLGTPGFIAPERLQSDGLDVDARADIWSIGATLVRLASGEGIFARLPQHAALAATATQQPPSLGTLVPSLPASFVQIVDKALALAPADRWTSAAEMKAALAEVGDDEPTRVGHRIGDFPMGGAAGDTPMEHEATQLLQVGPEPAGEEPSREDDGAPTLPPKARQRTPRRTRGGAPQPIPKIHYDEDDDGRSPAAGGTLVMLSAPISPASVGALRAGAVVATADSRALALPASGPPRPAHADTSAAEPITRGARVAVILGTLLVLIALFAYAVARRRG